MPDDTPTPHPAARCPLCGQHNQCAMVAGRPAESCWCMAARIPAPVLAAIPASARGTACVCPACGRAPGSAPGAAPI
ncbi:MAG: cysteine-rich CWC family protein [Acidovorax sp.]|uniref:cysteine-rich CWC family protein n=1 Tax=Acidovorax sp. TaxID=1872122 RepID=UPI0039E5B588